MVGVTKWTAMCFIITISYASAQNSCGKADFVFLLDESGSVGSDNFQTAKTFVNNVAASFTVGPNDIQIGLVTFATKPRQQFTLNTYATSSQIQTAIDAVDYANGGTFTADALAFMVSDSFSTAAGARDGVTKIAVVITDGESTDKADTRAKAQMARDAGITILAVGVGSNVDDNELNDIASDPDSQYVFKADSFDALKTIQDVLAKTACEVSQPESTECGHAALVNVVTGRMLNGRPNGRCEWPWMASVRSATSATDKQCGGVIVGRNKVITTAACALSITSGIEVVIGENNIYKDNEPLLASLVESVVAVETFVVHPNYNNVTTANDIAVLKLGENIEYSTCALPVCLPDRIPADSCPQYITHQCTMGAWGAYDDSLKRSRTLRTNYAKFIGPEVCDAIYMYARNNFLPQNTACVESINRQDNPCLYDHGGMVVCSRNGRWILHGIITLPSCFDQLPSLTVDITSLDIQEFIKNA